jgi:hypothetical protein
MSDLKWSDAAEGFGLDMTVENLRQRRGRVRLTSLLPTGLDFTVHKENNSKIDMQIMHEFLHTLNSRVLKSFN